MIRNKAKTGNRVRCTRPHRRNELLKFERDFLKKEGVDMARNYHIIEALYKEAVTLGVIPLKNPLDGIEVDLKIAKVINSV